jgi:hypothetical protein
VKKVGQLILTVGIFSGSWNTPSENTYKILDDAILNFVKKLNYLNNGYQVTSQIFDKGKVVFRPLSFSEYRTYKPYPWSIKKYSNFEWDCIKLPSRSNGKNVS